MQNAKCKMQNAKCKMNEAFRKAKAYSMVSYNRYTSKNQLPTTVFCVCTLLAFRSPLPDFAFCILHFAFRAQPDKPQSTILVYAKIPVRILKGEGR